MTSRWHVSLLWAKKKANKYGECWALYGHEASGRMGGPKVMNLLPELQNSCELRKLAKHSWCVKLSLLKDNIILQLKHSKVWLDNYSCRFLPNNSSIECMNITEGHKILHLHHQPPTLEELTMVLRWHSILHSFSVVCTGLSMLWALLVCNPKDPLPNIG